MKVRELILRLQAHDPEAIIAIPADDGARFVEVHEVQGRVLPGLSWPRVILSSHFGKRQQ